MSIVRVDRNDEALSLTVITEFAAPPARVWQVWSDPRQLERWWGPPTWPATFVEHDLRVDGGARYYMTGPEGEKAGGWWRFLACEEPRLIEFEDGFSDENGQPSTEMPTTRARVEFEEIPNGTRMTVTSFFSAADQMEQLVSMGMVEGFTQAVEQIDTILAEG